jgi:hypothetical protein
VRPPGSVSAELGVATEIETRIALCGRLFGGLAAEGDHLFDDRVHLGGARRRLDGIESIDHRQGHLEPGDVQASFFDEVSDPTEPPEVRVRIESLAPSRPSGPEEPGPLIFAEGLGVHLGEAGRDGDRVERLPIVHSPNLPFRPGYFVLPAIWATGVTLICFGFSCSAFGSRKVRIPFSNVAWARSGSTAFGRLIERIISP